MTIKAYKTECIGVTSIVFAESAGKARYDTYLSARDVGYKVEFKDIVVKRAALYDLRETIDGNIPTGRMCHTPENLKMIKVKK